MGLKLKVEFEVDIPDGVSLEEADEWLQYQLGERGGIKSANPLADVDLEARKVWISNAN